MSGLLNIIALRIADPNDADGTRAIEKLESWIWEDANGGTRVTGARSVAWDTAFTLQALAAAAPHCDVQRAVRDGTAFLTSQQIQDSFPNFPEHDRIDPRGGWCFADRGHGWPVSDCTAEALSALLAVPGARVEARTAEDAIAFILRCQNPDGGFGSYEARRSRSDLEMFNPAEMFGNSMTERSYVECTASCVMALNEARRYWHPALADRIDDAVARAARWLRSQQQPDGAWPGAWGVHFIYGTMFAVRGLLGTGAPVTDPAIRKACRWLLARQRDDGGWGEHHAGCLTGAYSEDAESQVIQTAWALAVLLEAHDPEWPAIERGAYFLNGMQNADGEWPKQNMVGVFFHTALLDAGFEVIASRDVAFESDPQMPWYRALQGRDLTLMSMPRTPIGRAVTNRVVRALEALRLAPEGTAAVSTLLNDGADALVEGGETGIFTPMFYFHACKPR